MDTKHMIWEEKRVLDYLRARRGQEVRQFEVIQAITKDLDPDRENGDTIKIVMSVCNRMSTERKIIRNCHNKTYRINEIYV